MVSTPLKNISQNGNLPQIGVKIKNDWNQHLVVFCPWIFWEPRKSGYQIDRFPLTYSAKGPKAHEIKVWTLFFLLKYVIPKSLKVGHWLSELTIGHLFGALNGTFWNSLRFGKSITVIRPEADRMFRLYWPREDLLKNSPCTKPGYLFLFHPF